MSGDEEGTDERGRRPTSARDAAGRDAGGRDAADEAGDRPTPVRVSMDAQRDAPEPREPPSRRLRRGEEEREEEWIVRVEGRAETGGAGDVGTPLLFLTFARSDDPERRLRETIRVGRSLAGLSEMELQEALDGARPFEGDWERSDLFAGTRKKRGG